MASFPGNLSKPTLLAFHGSGSNSTVHTVQLARLMRTIGPHFNVESLNGPFDSNAGPGVLPFFDGCGPFKGWMPNGVKIVSDETEYSRLPNDMPPEVEEVVRSAVSKARAEGSRVVGVIGFSQGTRVVAGLLKATEIRRALGEQAGKDMDWLDFRFGVSVCASYPPPLLSPSLKAQLASSNLSEEEQNKLVSEKIQLPSFFAQGRQDKWNDIGQKMISMVYEVADDKSVVKTWDNDHHYPLDLAHCKEIGDWMIAQLRKIQAQDTAA